MTHIVLSGHGSLDLRYPDGEQLTPLRIGWSLAQLNRFTGHAIRPYSVAEHSLLVAEIVKHLGGTVLAQLCGLMHDAAECITNDLSTPFKEVLRDESNAFDNAQQRYMNLIWRRYQLTAAASEHAMLVHKADIIALATERAQLLDDTGPTWPILTHVQPYQAVNLRAGHRVAASWEHWRDTWLDNFYELQTAAAARTHHVRTFD